MYLCYDCRSLQPIKPSTRNTLIAEQKGPIDISGCCIFCGTEQQFRNLKNEPIQFSYAEIVKDIEWRNNKDILAKIKSQILTARNPWYALEGFAYSDSMSLLRQALAQKDGINANRILEQYNKLTTRAGEYLISAYVTQLPESLLVMFDKRTCGYVPTHQALRATLNNNIRATPGAGGRNRWQYDLNFNSDVDMLIEELSNDQVGQS
jgi:hypothetical protein